MATIRFTPQLARFVAIPEAAAASASTLGRALEEVFAAHPALRGYVLDDQGHIRQHVAVFVDGRLHVRRHDLDVSIQPDADIYILQALSGGSRHNIAYAARLSLHS